MPTPSPRHPQWSPQRSPQRGLFWGLLLAAGLAAPAQAGPLPEGCYARTYDGAHLAAHPDQVVAEMHLHLFPPDAIQTQGGAFLRVRVADQGHAGPAGFGGRILTQGLTCFPGERWMCGVDCDGGTFEITRSGGDTLIIRTRYLTVGDTEECGGAIDIAEHPGQPVSYRLTRADPTQCRE